MADDDDNISRRLLELIDSQDSVDNLGRLMAIGAACALILKELALNMPAQFYVHLPAVLEQAVLAPLRDPRLGVREAAAELLAACREIGAQRERAALTSPISSPTRKRGSSPVRHASLLAHRDSSSTPVPPRTPAILAFRADRDPAVRRMVVAMIPALARHNTPAFKAQIRHKAMGHLFSLPTNKSTPDSTDIRARQPLSQSGTEIEQFLETVMLNIKTRLKEASGGLPPSTSARPTPRDRHRTDAHDAPARLPPPPLSGRPQREPARGTRDSALVGRCARSCYFLAGRAVMAAAAAWSLSEWDSMDNYIATMRSHSPDRFFHRGILSVHHNQFPKALTHISKARELLPPAFGGADYARPHNVMVRAQMLFELEEVIMYKQYADQPERQQMMRNTWMKRLQGCQPDVEVWQRILRVRTLIINPEDDPIASIKFANLCHKSDRMALAEKTINSSNTRPSTTTRRPAERGPRSAQVHVGARRSLAERRQFTINLVNDLQAESLDHAQRAALTEQRLNQLGQLRWTRIGTDDGGKAVLKSYSLATTFDKGWYKAWHTWPWQTSTSSAKSARRRKLFRPSMSADFSLTDFIQSISLRDEDALQDTLRLLTLWFKHGAHDEISHAIASGFSVVNIDTWLPVLIYPLTVRSNSPREARKNAVPAIMERMHEHSATIVEQARIVSRELIRVAILWHELWHEGLDEAARLYYTVRSPAGILAVLEPLHEMLEAVFQKIDNQLPQLTALDLQYVSPELLNVWNLDLVEAASASYGIGGKRRTGLPIGHEDLRQDERVMQLFSLVNTLLSVDTNSFKRQLHIQQYRVIPLAPNAGLIGVVQESDTLHELVKDYPHSMLLNIEYRLMFQVSSVVTFSSFTVLFSDLLDGTRLREPSATAEDRGLRVHDGE
ncbi:FAT domain-containing protein [Mycena epipterygia]|nr:FAT domain-containing protein [Mycena epipterygia]